MKVVIIGGGFGGIKAALNLANDPNFQVTLVSDKPNFEYHAALYRSATGRSALEVVIPLTEFFQDTENIELVEDRVISIDPIKRTVTSADNCHYRYDALILALGVVTEYYGINGLQQYSFGIKSIHEALELKRHLHDELAKPDDMDSNFVIIGGGPTGVELAGDFVGYLKTLCRRHGVRKKFKLDLVEAAPRLLPVLPEAVSKRVQQRLKQLGIKVFTNTAVKAETIDALQLPHGDIKTHTVVWTAGVTNNPFFKANSHVFTLAKANKVEVDANLQAVDSIYVIGDSAKTAYSGLAQTAIYDAHFVTTNLKRQLAGQEPIAYHPPLPLAAIPVGPKWAAVSIGRWRFYGRFGWWVRRYLDLQLYRSFLPFGKALRIWIYGNRLEETCPVCARDV